jgi:hypothetical protein
MDNPCQGVRGDGKPCSKGAMGAEARAKHHVPPDTPRLCYWCWRGNEAMERAGHIGNSRRKKPISSVSDVYGYETVLELLAPALVAMVDEPGFPVVPDWDARLCACALLIECLPDWLRETPEQTRELLDRLLPKRVGYEAMNPDAAYPALAEAKHRLRERQHPLMQFVERS